MKTKACAPGYYGYRCEKPCLPGTFGEQCGGVCACVAEDCDQVRGCLFKDTSTVTVTSQDVSVQQHKVLNLSTSSERTITSTSDTAIRYTILRSTMQSMIESNSENRLFNTNVIYLMIGMGAVIVILMAILIKKMCSQSQSVQRKVSERKSENYNEIKAPVDSTASVHRGENKDHHYQHMEFDYQEIDPCLLKLNSGISELCSSSSAGTSGVYLEPVNEEPYNEPRNTAMYLDPPEMQMGRRDSRTEQNHTYIEMI